MSHHELERQAVRGEEVARLLACDAVREVIEEQLASRRETILALKASQTAEFGRVKAGLEAMEELVAALSSVAELGELARERLGEALEATATGGRVL